MAELYFKVGSDWEEVVRLRSEIDKLLTQLKTMDANKAPHAVAVLNKQINESEKQLKGMVEGAAKAAVIMDGDFKSKIYNGSKAVNSLTSEIIKQKAIIQETKEDVRLLSVEYNKMSKYDSKAPSVFSKLNKSRSALAEQQYALGELQSQQSKAKLSVKELKDEYALYKTEVKDSTASTFSFGKALGVVGGIAAIRKLGSDIIKVRSEFRSMEISLETMIGEEKAKGLMSEIKQYAAISPLGLKEVQSATEMMVGFNIEAEKTPRFIQAIGDISRGESQKFQSLSLAFSQMSSTGKLMGQDLNQMINAGFNPLQIIAEKTGKTIAQLKDEMSKGAISSEIVQQAFIDATSAGGKFYNMAQKQSGELSGQLSILGDTIDNALNDMGAKSEGVIMSGVKNTTALVENYETVGKVLVGLIGTYGAYRVALMLTANAEKGYSLTTMILRGRLIATQKATALLNTTMLKNPYVAATVAVGALVTAMWALSDSTTAAEKAQNRFKEEQEQAQTNIDGEIGKVNELIQTIKDETKSKLDRVRAFDTLKQIYPSIFAKYRTEAELLKNIADVQKEIAERQPGMQRAANEMKFEEYDKKWSEQNSRVNQKGDRASDKMIEKRDELWELRKNYQEAVFRDIHDSFVADISTLTDQEIDQYTNTIKEKLKKSSGDIKLELGRHKGYYGEGVYDAVKVRGLLSTLEGEKNARANQTTYSQDYEKAKTEWDNAKSKFSEIEKDKSKFTTKQYEEAKKTKELTEKRYKDLGGVVGSSLDKQENQAEKLRKESEKYKFLLDKNKRIQNIAEVDALNEITQSTIDAMEKGSAKTLAQRELNHKKEIQAIHREAEDRKQQLIDSARAEFEADPTNKKRSFNPADFLNNKSVQDRFKQIDEQAASKLNSKNIKYGRGDDMVDLLDEYKDYADKRIGIEKKFNDDIAVLQEVRKREEKKGNTDEIAKIDRSISKATANKGRALMMHDFDVLKQSPEYIRAFENLRNTSSETLNSLLKQLESAKGIASEVLNPKDLREYTTTIQEIMDELDERNPFQSIADKQRELAEAERELAEAKRQLDEVNKGAKVITGTKEKTLGSGKTKIEATYLSATEALNKYNAAKDKTKKANNNFIQAEKKAKDKIDELALAIKGVGNAIGGQQGEIISLIGDISLFAADSIDGIAKVAVAGAEAMSAVEKASVILSIISAGIQLMQQLNSILPTADNQYEKYAEKISEINKLTDAVNDYRIAALEAQQAESNWFSEDNLRNLRDYKKIHDKIAEAYTDKIKEPQAIYQNKSGGGWLTKPWNWLLDNTYGKIYGIDFAGKYKEGQTAAINNLRIETRSRKKGFLGSGLGGRSQKTEDLTSWARNNGLGELFDKNGLINKKSAGSILKQYGDKLVGQTKETLESLVKLREKYDEYIQHLHEYVSSLYEPLVDNFVDSIWDWFDSGKDALDSFKSYASDTFRGIVSDMMRTIVLDKVVGSFSEDIAALYEEYARGAISEAELMKKVAEKTDGLVENYESNIPTLQNIMEQVNGYLQSAGIDLKNTETTTQPSKKGFAVASQDSIDELNGRFTAGQIAWEETKNQAVMQTQSLGFLNSQADMAILAITDTRNIADETRTILADSYLELVRISEHTGAIIKPIESIQKDIAEVKKNTSKL